MAEDNGSVQNTPTSVATGISAAPQPNAAPITGVSNPPDNGNVSIAPQSDEYSTPIPQGASTQAPDEYSTPIPQGATLGNAPSAPDNRSSLSKATDEAAQQHAAGVPWAGWKEAGLEVAGIPSGIGEGIVSTVSGAANISNQVVEGLTKSLNLNNEQSESLRAFLAPVLGPTVMLPQGARNELNKVAGQGEQGNAGENIGYGGETLAEFIMGDAALKALPVAQRMEAAAKAITTIEGSPRLAQALKFGTRMLSLAGIHGTEAGLVQGTQAALRTPGTLEQKAETGLRQGSETAALAGAADIPAQGISALASKVGSAAEGARNLAALGEVGKSPAEISEGLQAELLKSHTQMGQDYEDAIRGVGNEDSIENRLEGETIEAKTAPMAEKAQELLANPIPEEHPVTALAKTVAGDKLDGSTRKLLQQIADGEVPVEPEEAGPTLLDANGKPITGPEVQKTKPLAPYTIHDLIQTRQAVRKAAEAYPYGDVNAYALRSLNRSIDDTIGEMASKSGDPSVLKDYQNIRSDYKAKVDAFDNSVVKQIMNGNPGNAVNQFIATERANSALPSSKRANFNVNDLRTLIGDNGVKAFGNDVFNNLLRNSIERRGTNALPDNLVEALSKGRFNPAKFVSAWNTISPETKAQLFNSDLAQSGLEKLAKDAQTAALLQHATRLGLFATIGGLVGPHVHVGMGLGAAIGLVAGEGGSYMPVARDLLNYAVLNPTLWKGYEKVGKLAGKSTGIVPSTAAAATTDLLNNNKENLKNSLNATQGVLSNTGASPNQ